MSEPHDFTRQPLSFRIARDPIRIIETARYDYGDARCVEVPMVKVHNQDWRIMGQFWPFWRANVRREVYCRLVPSAAEQTESALEVWRPLTGGTRGDRQSDEAKRRSRHRGRANPVSDIDKSSAHGLLLQE